jgi:Biotin-lipoyl like
VILGVIAGVWYWLYSSQFEETDDAYVTGHEHPVSFRVAGTISEVLVDDNQLVKQGHPVAQLDPKDFQVAPAQARASLEQAKTQLGQSQAQTDPDRCSGALISQWVSNHPVTIFNSKNLTITQKSHTMLDIIRRNNSEQGRMTTTRLASEAIPVRKGTRPKTIIGPLHVQYNGHGDPKYLKLLLNDILSWPYIEPTPTDPNHLDKVSIRLQEIAATNDSSPFISGTEFARVLLATPTIILVLPLACARWAIVKGWAEPHYLHSFGLMPAGTVIVYTPRNREELEVCYSLFFESYYFACKFVREEPIRASRAERPAIAVAVAD